MQKTRKKEGRSGAGGRVRPHLETGTPGPRAGGQSGWDGEGLVAGRLVSRSSSLVTHCLSAATGSPHATSRQAHAHTGPARRAVSRLTRRGHHTCVRIRHCETFRETAASHSKFSSASPGTAAASFKERQSRLPVHCRCLKHLLNEERGDTLIQVLCPGRARLRAQHTPRSKAPIYNSSCQDLEKCRSSSYSSVLEGGDSSALWSKRFSSLETMPSDYVTTDWPLSCQEFNAANHVVS